MRKVRIVLALLLLCFMMIGVVSCAQKKCSMCGSTKNCKTYTVFGEEVNLCENCRIFK